MLAAILCVGCVLLILSSVGLFCNVMLNAFPGSGTCYCDIQDHPQGGNLQLRGLQTFLLFLVPETGKYPLGQHQTNNYPAASMSGIWEEAKALVPVQTFSAAVGQ